MVKGEAGLFFNGGNKRGCSVFMLLGRIPSLLDQRATCNMRGPIFFKKEGTCDLHSDRDDERILIEDKAGEGETVEFTTRQPRMRLTKKHDRFFESWVVSFAGPGETTIKK